jgi:hypothetical protein
MEPHLPAVDKADSEAADAHSAVLQEAPQLVADAGLNLYDISASITLVDASLTWLLRRYAATWTYKCATARPLPCTAYHQQAHSELAKSAGYIPSHAARQLTRVYRVEPGQLVAHHRLKVEPPNAHGLPLGGQREQEHLCRSESGCSYEGRVSSTFVNDGTIQHITPLA